MIEDIHLSTNSKRRRKILKLRPEILFSGMFRKGMFLECLEGIPEGTDIVGIHYSHSPGTWDICLQNNEFEEISTGEELPELEVKFKSYWGPELQAILKIIGDVKNAQNY